jgi:phage tail-like protein
MTAPESIKEVNMPSLLQKVSGDVGGASQVTKTVAPGLLQKTSNISTPADFTKIPNWTDDEYPVPIYLFGIHIKDSENPVALFQSVSGMEVTRNVEPLEVGGLNNYGNEFPGQLSFGHITFGVGLTSHDFFWSWMMDGAVQGYARKMDFTLKQRRPSPTEIADGEDILPVVKTWKFVNAFPVSWKISDLDVDDSNKIVIESLELSFDYFILDVNE